MQGMCLAVGWAAGSQSYGLVKSPLEHHLNCMSLLWRGLTETETQSVSRTQRWGLGSSLRQDRRKLKDMAADSKDDINKHSVICFWLSNKLTSNFIYSVHKCFLSIYFLPTTVPDPRDISVNEMYNIRCPRISQRKTHSDLRNKKT